MLRMLPIVTMAFLVFVNSSAHSIDLDVNTLTKDCNGKTGFTSFRSSHLYKIQEGDCVDPDKPSEKLQQVFVKTPLFPNSYDVLWVTKKDAELITQQIREGRAIDIERLRRPLIRVDVHQQSATPKPITPKVTEQKVRSVAPEVADSASSELTSSKEVLNITMLEPNLPLTRSSTRILASSTIDSRTIVGKVESETSLLSVTVNGISVPFKESGVFKSEIDLNNSLTPVKVVAVDNDGNRTQVDFSFVQHNKSDASEFQSGFGNFKALIIANADYKFMDVLETPSNDAEAIKNVLANDYGFEVEVLNNANRYELVSSLNNLRASLTDDDNLLIYYAGHGTFDEVNKRGHWLPVDAEPSSTANWVSEVEISGIINAMSAKHILLVADSCYSGALTRSIDTKLEPGLSEDARKKWLKTISSTRSRHVLTSGDLKPVLDDGGDGHSIFAKAFIDVLSSNKEIIVSSTIFSQVKDKVSERSRALGKEQTPRFSELHGSDHEFGDFLFISNRE